MNQPAADVLRPPAERGSGRALLLAALMHLLLVVLIAFGVHWHSHTPEAVQAELWAPTAHLAAPPAPQPVQQPQPQPAPQPQPQPAPPPPAVQPQTTPQPDQAEIALRQKHKLEREQAKQRAEQLAQEKAAKLAEQEHQKQLAQQRAQAERKAAEQAAAKQAAEQKAAEKAAEKKAAALKAAQEKAAERKQEQQLAALQKQSRQDYMKNLMSQAGNGSSSAGTAAVTSGPSGGYAARLGTLIRENVIYPQIDQIDGNPKVTLSVVVDTNTGEVMGVSVKQSSGVASWDQAVLRAVKRLGRLPSDHGRWWSPMEVVAGPRDHAN